MGLPSQDEPECMEKDLYVTGLESDPKWGRGGLPTKWVSCQLGTCREKSGIPLKKNTVCF